MIKVELSKIQKKVSSINLTVIGVGATDWFTGLTHLTSRCSGQRLAPPRGETASRQRASLSASIRVPAPPLPLNSSVRSPS